MSAVCFQGLCWDDIVYIYEYEHATLLVAIGFFACLLVLWYLVLLSGLVLALR